MKPQSASEPRWVGVDLHVHTPASKDYRGNRDSTEYLKMIQGANQFESSPKLGTKKIDKEGDSKSIGCVAFTDHNTVEGFRTYRRLQQETEELSKAIRLRDPENALALQLERDLDVYRAARVLMGVEIKADPGIHLLIIFAESVEPDHVVSFLEQAYQTPYKDFEGDPKPATQWTLKQTLDKIEEVFADKAFVVFPHVDSGGGVYEDLKDFAQARIAALTHSVVKALSFNRMETREKILELFKQPDYQRTQPVAMIQSSDFHGEEGSTIGQLRAEVCVREGKATFRNLRESFREHGRVKCSIDLVSEEYQRLVKGMFVAKYISEPGKLEFGETDFESLAENICGMLNSTGGIIELDGYLGAAREGQAPWTIVRDQMTLLLKGTLNPPFEPSLFRSFQFSPGKIRVLARIRRSDRLCVANSKVFINNDGGTKLATPLEIEFSVSRNLEFRFGSRFTRTLKNVSRESILLSKLPRGIALILASEDKMMLSLPDSFSVTTIDPASDAGGEVGELVDDLIESEHERFPFGNPEGNTSLITDVDHPRERDHYLRLTVRRADVNEEILGKCSRIKVDQPAIIFYLGGLVGLIEPGYVISDSPAMLLQLDQEWQDKARALLGWLKSSFFVWYCAVRLGSESPFLELQSRPYRIPIPLHENAQFLRAMDGHATSIINAKMNFMNDLNRLKKKGTLDSNYQEKARQNHNAIGNRACLAIDKEVSRFLHFSDGDSRFIAQTLRDINLTDFGLLEELKAQGE